MNKEKALELAVELLKNSDKSIEQKRMAVLDTAEVFFDFLNTKINYPANKSSAT